jgi:hypothetical protein
MLTGIKVGKKKAKVLDNNNRDDDPQLLTTSTAIPNSDGRSTMNEMAANALRELLQQPSSGITTIDTFSTRTDNQEMSAEQRKQVWDHHCQNERSFSNKNINVTTAKSEAETYPQVTLSCQIKDESDMSVMELLKQEKAAQKYNSAEQQVRSMYKELGKHTKRERSHNIDADDDDDDWQTHLYSSSSTNVNSSDAFENGTATVNSKVSAGRKSQGGTAPFDVRRFKDKIMTSSCPWWIQSSNFQSYRLITQNFIHVTISIAPPSQSLIYGEHFYIVPIEYTPALTACDDNVWDEIRIIQSMIRSIGNLQNKGAIFFETVFESRSKGVWQTKLEAVFVPMPTYQDTALYFRSALTEQAEEHGTNPKLIVTNTTKTLRNSIPKHFPYFYVEYNHNNRDGYILVIESSNFPKNFGIDTIASMMRMEPIRFRSNKKSISEKDERLVIAAFMKRYENELLNANE